MCTNPSVSELSNINPCFTQLILRRILADLPSHTLDAKSTTPGLSFRQSYAAGCFMSVRDCSRFCRCSKQANPLRMPPLLLKHWFRWEALVQWTSLRVAWRIDGRLSARSTQRFPCVLCESTDIALARTPADIIISPAFACAYENLLHVTGELSTCESHQCPISVKDDHMRLVCICVGCSWQQCSRTLTVHCSVDWADTRHPRASGSSRQGLQEFLDEAQSPASYDRALTYKRSNKLLPHIRCSRATMMELTHEHI